MVALPLSAQQHTILSSKIDARAALTITKNTRHQGYEALVPVYLTLSDSSVKQRLTQDYQVHFNVQCGNTYTAIVPQSNLLRLTADSAVQRMAMGEELSTFTDKIRQKTLVDMVHSGTDLPTSYKGKDVLVGIIDSGFDFTHPNFMDATQQCRILKVWDQNGASLSPNSYGYGTFYETPVQIAAARHDNAATTHGTHVAGIAAGSAETPYKGMAPESELVLVSTNRSEQGIVDGVDFLVRYAQEVGRPIIINVSLGTMMGFKDGSGTMARMVDNLLKDKKGCLMTVAVGNEGHRKSTLRGNGVSSIWKFPSFGSDQLFVESRPQEKCTFRLTLRNKKTAEVLFDKSFETGQVWTEKYEHFGTADKERALLVAQSLQNEVTGAFALTFHVGYTLQEDEEWKVELNSTRGTALAYSNNGTFSSEGYAGFTDGSTESTIAMTATGHLPIAVGATVSRNKYTSLSGVETIKPWALHQRYPLSAMGPTSDGRIKPDIVAPGAAVVSSYNSFAAPKTVKRDDVVYQQAMNGKTYYWYVESGTSMATPTVSGILALWLQACPSLTATQVKEVLRKTAKHDSFMGQLANNQYGMGEINALSGLRELLNSTGIDIPSAAFEYVYDPYTSTLSTTGVNSIRVYGLDGRLLLSTTEAQVNLHGLPQGIYLIKISRAKEEKTIKVRV